MLDSIRQAREKRDDALEAERATAQAERDALELAKRQELQAAGDRGPVLPVRPVRVPITFRVNDADFPGQFHYETVIPLAPADPAAVQAEMAPITRRIIESLRGHPDCRRLAALQPQWWIARDKLQAAQDGLAKAKEDRRQAIANADENLTATLERVDADIVRLESELPTLERRAGEFAGLADGAKRNYVGTVTMAGALEGRAARQAAACECEKLAHELYGLPDVQRILGRVAVLQEAATLIEFRQAHMRGVDEEIMQTASNGSAAA